MGFGSYIGGVLLAIIAVLLVVLGIAVMLDFFKFVPTSYDLPLGIGIIIVALVLFMAGWYAYASSKPKGQVNVHNV